MSHARGYFVLLQSLGNIENLHDNCECKIELIIRIIIISIRGNVWFHKTSF